MVDVDMSESTFVVSEDPQIKSKIFDNVHFHVIVSSGIPEDRAEELSKSLCENGAVHVRPKDPKFLDYQEITHFITTTIDFENYEPMEEQMKAIVTPLWVEQSIAKGKIANPRQFSPDPRLFFSGLVVAVVGLPDGDKDAIIGGLVAMGGLYSPQVSKLTTHIVALHENNQQCQIVRSKNLNCKIVLPHWFDDCLRLGQRIDEAPYLLPNPPILHQSASEKIVSKPRPDLQGALSPNPQGLPTPQDSKSPFFKPNVPSINMFKSKKIMLSADLRLSEHLQTTITELVTSRGGNIVETWSDADVFVCHYRDGEDYKNASSHGKTVGNLSWLYYMISHNVWTSPLRRLLHYPIARGGLPGFKEFRISLSNYNGEARIFLENLAKAAGCEFTKTMKTDNTHLITAHLFSEKCEAAKEWNINIVNHLWLEESYANWKVMSLTDPRYTRFPPRTNLSDLVGFTPIDKKALETYFYPRLQTLEDMPAVKGKSIPTVLFTKGQVEAATETLSKTVIEKTPKAPKQSAKVRPNGAHATPVALRAIADDKENQTPSTGSRSAKAKAAEKLHGMASDIALYEKEKKRVGGVTHGGQKKDEAVVKEVSRKRSISAEADEESSDSSTDIYDVPVVKRTKREKPVSIKTALISRLLVTGYKWEDKKLTEAKARLRDLGVLLTENYDNCDILAAPRLLRTQKFVCAIARAPVVVSMDFVFDSVSENELRDPKNYPLKDPENEKKYGVKLEDVLLRARVNGGKLLNGEHIYTTDKVKGGFEPFKSIVESNGGRCFVYRGRAGAISSKRSSGDDTDEEEEVDDEEPQFVYLMSGSTVEESRLWPKFRQAAEQAGKVARIVRTDWILDLAIRQQIGWSDDYDVTMDDINAE